MKKVYKKINHTKHLIIIVALGIVGLFTVLVMGNIYYEKIYPVSSSVQFGVTFSPYYAQDLGQDWKTTYLSLIQDLKVKNIRLNSYWDIIQPAPTQFNFQDLDYMFDLASKNNVKVLLIVGIKQSRWPECRIPGWAKELSLGERRQKNLEFIEKVITRYQNNSSLWAYQVENEPLLNYGHACDPHDRDYLKQEVQFVKKLDPRKPIILTDSGELRFWRTPMQLADIFGTTLYRETYNPILGYFYWPLPPAFYNFKSSLITKIFAQGIQKTIIVELQTEPWLPQEPAKIPVEDQIEIFDLDNFKNNVEFARRTGFDTTILWGVEWWYYMSSKNHPEYLEYAKTLF